MFVVPQHELVVGQVACDSFEPDVELAFVAFVSTPNFVAVVAALYAAVVALREAFLVELEPCSVRLIDALVWKIFSAKKKHLNWATSCLNKIYQLLQISVYCSVDEVASICSLFSYSNDAIAWAYVLHCLV